MYIIIILFIKVKFVQLDIWANIVKLNVDFQVMDFFVKNSVPVQRRSVTLYWDVGIKHTTYVPVS